MARRIYPNPPIVEAIIELRFAEAVKREELVAAIADQQGGEYSGQRRRQELVKVVAAITAEDATSGIERVPHAEFLSSPGGHRAVGCRDGALSFHVMTPYPGWENFRTHVVEVLAQLPDSIAAQSVGALAVRYIDRIVLPSLEVQLQEYFAVIPSLPQVGPQAVAGLNFVAVRMGGDKGIETSMTLRLDAASADGRPAVFFDFLAVQPCNEAVTAAAHDNWWPVIEALHELQRDSFEACITDKCRELFQ